MVTSPAAEPLVVIGKVAVSWFWRTVTVEGTVTFVGSLELRLTTAPPTPGSQSRVTVPVELAPAVTVSGCSERPLTTGLGWVRLTEAVSVTEGDGARAAVTVTGEAGTPRAVAEKKALFEPEGTVTVGGTASESGVSLVRPTEVSEGAGTSRVTRFELKAPG